MNAIDSAILATLTVCTGEGEYLNGTVQIFGGWFHVEAFAVDSEGKVLDEEQSEKVIDVWSGFSDGQFSTVRIPGYEFDYVIIVTPFDN